MNERIEELLKQAGAEPSGYQDQEWSYSGFDPAKFAELIVRECMSFARGMRNPSNLNYKPSDHFVNELRLHFGVE